MTPNKEDYLKLIYEHGGQNNLVSNKVLATGLHISPASVTEMLSKLSREGLLIYEPYKGSMLTEKGLESCLHVVRSHRLWEVFLIRHLGYSWSEAHEDAHILEHAAPSRMISRLDTFLNHPAYCPHGSEIPQPGKKLHTPDLIPLTKLHVGDEREIKQVTEEKSLLDYLQGLGISIGAKIKIISIEDYEGPFHTEVDGKETYISYKAASQILTTKAK